MRSFLRRLAVACTLALAVLGLPARMAQATVNSAVNKAIVLGNGSQTQFTFSFIGVATAYISVIYTDANGNETTLSQGNGSTQYQITLNAPIQGAIWGLGGTVTYNPGGTPIANGTTLTIVRTLPLTQAISLQNLISLAALGNGAETGLDLGVMLDQQSSESLGRAIVAPIVDPPTINLTLPPAAQRANTGLAFDSQGNVIAGVVPATGLISSAMQPVVDAASLAAGRAAFGLGAAAVLSPNCGLLSNVSAAGNLDVGSVLTQVASNQSITAANCNATLVATGPITLTLARASTLWNGFGFWVHVVAGGQVTLTPNASDTIEGLSSGTSAGLPIGSWAWITTDAASSGTWRVNLSYALGSSLVDPKAGRFVPLIAGTVSGRACSSTSPFNCVQFCQFRGNQILINGALVTIPTGAGGCVGGPGGIMAEVDLACIENDPPTPLGCNQPLAPNTTYYVYDKIISGVQTLVFSTQAYNVYASPYGNAVMNGDSSASLVGLLHTDFSQSTFSGTANQQNSASWFNPVWDGLTITVGGNFNGAGFTGFGPCAVGNYSGCLTWVQWSDNVPTLHANCVAFQNSGSPISVSIGIGVGTAGSAATAPASQSIITVDSGNLLRQASVDQSGADGAEGFVIGNIMGQSNGSVTVTVGTNSCQLQIPSRIPS